MCGPRWTQMMSWHEEVNDRIPFIEGTDMWATVAKDEHLSLKYLVNEKVMKH